MGPLHARGPVGQRHYAGGEFSIGALNSELAGAHSYCRFWAWPKTLPDLELENARFWPISKGWIDPAVTYGFRPEAGIVLQEGMATQNLLRRQTGQGSGRNSTASRPPDAWPSRQRVSAIR